MREIFKTRYQAEKERKSNPYMNSTYHIVKVDGGYTIMDTFEYIVWKKQK